MQVSNQKSIIALFVLSLFLPGSSVYSANLTEGKYLGAVDTEYPDWFRDSFLELPDDLEEISDSGKNLILFFYQGNCPYCHALINKNFSQKDIRDKTQKQFEVIALHMFGDREVVYFDNQSYSEKSLANKLKIQFTPTLIFYDKAANIVQRLNGYRSPAQFSVELDYAITILTQEKPIDKLSYLKKNYKPSQSKEKLFDEDFFTKPPFDASHLLKASNKPLAVFFEQRDCPSCENLHLNVLKDAETRKIISKFNVIQLDMWAKTPVITPSGNKQLAKDWAKDLKINYAPSIVLFDSSGNEIIRSEAIFKIFHTQSIFDYVLSEKYKTEPSFQRYLSERAQDLRAQGIDVDIWK